MQHVDHINGSVDSINKAVGLIVYGACLFTFHHIIPCLLHTAV